MKGSTYIKVALLVLSASSGFKVFAGECDEVGLSTIAAKIPANSSVEIFIGTNDLAAGTDAKSIVKDAVTALSGKVSGIVFNFVDTQNIENPGIKVDFGKTKGDKGQVSDYSGTPLKVGGPLDDGRLQVHLAQLGCGIAADSLCYDPSNAAAYKNALYRMVVHELLHALGATDSATDDMNIMSRFHGVNTELNQASGLACILQKLPTLRGDPPAKPPMCS